MSNNITLNIVEPGSPTPIDPVVPNTGLFTSGIGGAEAAIIVTITLVAILAIVGAFIYYKKKHGKSPSLFARFKHTKTTTGLAVLALLVSIGTVAGLVKLTTSAIEGNEAENAESDSSLTVDVSDTELTIELADDPVFAILPVDVTVEEATLAGYTLTASTNNTSLVSTTDSSKVIPMVAADEDELVALADNTYGLALEEKPTTKDAEVYMPLSTDSSNPTILKAIDDYSSTPANDTTTIYYGFYITPDTPYGTYTGSNITVDAIPNIATVTYNANGLYFNDSEEATENTVGYKPNIAEAPIEEVVGEYLTPAPLTPVDPSTPIHYTFLGWSETEGATTPTYTSEEDILANLTLSKNESLTLYAVWHYDTVLSFNGNTSDGGTSLADITIPAGDTITLPQNTYTRTGSVFTNWNTVAEPTEQDPGESYEDEADFTAPTESADITLYAQWAYYTTITFNGNGADSGYMSPQDIIAGTPETLTPNAFTKTNATFIGWNTVQYPTPENPGTAYEDQAEYIASTTEHEDITLYAQWAYTTISFNGNNSDAGTMNPITIAGGTTSNLPAKAFTKNNCIFTGWNTEASGTGISYGDSTPYTANATTIEAFTLYAQWQCISQVNYYGNGATSGEMASSIILGGSTLTFPQNTYTKDGYVFNGWNTVQNPTAENPGTSYPDQGTFAAPMTPATTLNLYAQWKLPPKLYDTVAAMSKGTQDAAALQATITAPTTDDPATDTSNSGVYEYNTTVFGEATDASNTNKIYYYRGILEQEADQGSYGSDGKATTYPNYVKLANNTCWRIVRTTGSGGVKMVYNGTWQGTAESGTCANNTTNAQLTTSPFNNNSATVAGKDYTGLQYQNMHAIGYTYSNVAASTTSSTALSTLLGATGDDTTTNTNSSIIKQYIEDWYSTNMVNASSSSYTSILEESAGYCNDRSVYNKDSYAASTVLPDSTKVRPYGTSGLTEYYFGAYTRNKDTAQNPSLTCPRGIVDTYSTTTTSGGNGQLTHPIALLTADEMSFAGSGSSTASQGSSYNAKSYLRSGNGFWLLSPNYRYSGGHAREFALYSNGALDYDNVGSAGGVRPAISLKPGTTVASGTGIATDPWIINE